MTRIRGRGSAAGTLLPLLPLLLLLGGCAAGPRAITRYPLAVRTASEVLDGAQQGLALDGNTVNDGTVRFAVDASHAGMVLTVEPGLYFPPGQEGDAGRFAGIGVRIEDDVAVTATGGENLTAELPTALEDVEALVQGVR